MSNSSSILGKEFCPDCMKKKMRFRTIRDANAFRSQDERYSKQTPYWCSCCDSWHLTSLPTGKYKRVIKKKIK